MLEEIILFMGSLDPTWIYIVLFLFSFIENVFPPSPSDVVVVVGASLISSTTMGFIPVLLITSFGSSLGFLLMYYVGKIAGDKVIKSGKLKFLNAEDISKTENWFNKYGYKLILANRFMPGTRSVISFFSGVYKLDQVKTFTAATISAFAWNVGIIALGVFLGNNVQEIDYYLKTYSKVLIIITLVVIIIWAIRYFLKKRKSNVVEN